MEKMKIKREEKNHKKGVIIIRSSFFFNVEICVCVCLCIWGWKL